MKPPIAGITKVYDEVITTAPILLTLLQATSNGMLIWRGSQR